MAKKEPFLTQRENCQHALRQGQFSKVCLSSPLQKGVFQVVLLKFGFLPKFFPVQ